MKIIGYSLLIFLLFVFFSSRIWAQKRYQTFEIDAPQLQTKKTIWVYLPINYEKTNKSYPVLYMHDAQNLFDSKSSYAGEWKVDETLDSLKANLIVIGIEHGGDKRLEELTPFPNEKHGGGKADLYLDFIVNNLKPYVDKNYRAKSSKKHTGIMGSSLGGLVSLYAVFKFPETFGKAGVFSPSLWFTNDIYNFVNGAKKSKAKLYFLCGDDESEEMIPDLNRMLDLITDNRCNCLHLTQSEIIKGGKHNEKLWSENFGNAYLWLFK